LFFPQVVRFAARQRNPQFLSRLRELHYNYRPGVCMLDILDIDWPFCLLGSRSVYLEQIRAERIVNQPRFLAPFPSNVENLAMRSCRIDDSIWSQLLAMTPKLKKLVYVPFYVDPIIEGPDYMETSPLAVERSLQLVKTTLETLILSNFGVHANEKDFLGSLHDFPKLRFVNVQASMLVGSTDCKAPQDLWELLPPTLKHLSLWACRGDGWAVTDRADIGSQLRGVVSRKKGLFPQLKTVFLDLSFSGFSQDDRVVMETEFSAQGVGFERSHTN